MLSTSFRHSRCPTTLYMHSFLCDMGILHICHYRSLCVSVCVCVEGEGGLGMEEITRANGYNFDMVPNNNNNNNGIVDT